MPGCRLLGSFGSAVLEPAPKRLSRKAQVFPDLDMGDQLPPGPFVDPGFRNLEQGGDLVQGQELPRGTLASA